MFPLLRTGCLPGLQLATSQEILAFNKALLTRKDFTLKTNAGYGNFRHHRQVTQGDSWAGRSLGTLPNHRLGVILLVLLSLGKLLLAFQLC